MAASRKASKPNADEIAAAKKLWEKLRRKSHVEKEERQKLVGELFEIITGRVYDFVFKHDSVRVIQCAVKYSTILQKKEIAKELKGTYRSLAESRYGKFLLAKMIVEGDQETKDMIIPEFYGHIKKLVNHPEASWILDDVYRTVATKEQKAIMLREWYAPEYAVFRHDGTKVTSNLASIFKQNPEKRPVIMKYLQERINQLVQKKMTGFTMLHDAMLQYFLNLSHESEDFTDFLRLVIGDNKEEETDLLQNLAFTQSGSELVASIIAWSSAKDRRQILKAYKDVIELLAFDKWGYRVIIAAFECLDDTREITQRVYGELLLLGSKGTPEAQAEKVLTLSGHQSGHIVLLYPFLGASRKLLWLETVQFMQRIIDIRKTTSKKDPQIRRTELITAISPILLHAIEVQPAGISSTPFGCQFITEVLLDGIGDKTVALAAVAALAKGDPEEASHLTHSPSAGKMLKALIAGGHYDHQAKKVVLVDPPLNFAELILQTIRSEQVPFSKWVLSEGAFVVLQLLEASFSNKEDLKYVQKSVKACKSEIQAMVELTSKDDVVATRKAKAGQLLLEAIAS